MKTAGEQVMLPIYSSSTSGSVRLSSSENVYSSVRHVSEADMRGLKTHHYDAEVTVDMKQHNRGPSCFRCGDTSHGWKNCDVASSDESVKQCAGQFSRVKKASDKERVLRKKGRTERDTRIMSFLETPE